MSELNELNIKVDRKNISLVVKEVAAFCGKYTVKVSPDITDGVLIVHGRVNSDNRDIYNGLKDWEDRERWQDENDIYAFCEIENGEGTLDLGVAKLGKAMAGKDLGETMYVGVSVFADGALVGLGDMEVMVTNAYEQNLPDQELIMFKGKDGKDFVISKVSATFSTNNTFFTTLVKLDDGTHLLTFYMPKGMLTGPKGDPGSLETTGEVVMKTIRVLESDHYYLRPCNLSLRGEYGSYDANVDINPSAADIANDIEDEFYRNTISQSSGVMMIGSRNKAIGTKSSILIGSESELKGEGNNIAAGYGNKVDGRSSVAIGYESEAKGHMSIALGYKCKALTSGSIATGSQTEASTGLDYTTGGSGAHAEGHQTKALNLYAHAEGSGSVARAIASHAEGGGTEAMGQNSHAEGSGTKVDTMAEGAHAEGAATTCLGKFSHSEGRNTEARYDCSHAEGDGTSARGAGSHAEGQGSWTIGNYSHAEGKNTKTGIIKDGTRIEGYYSHAEGNETVSASGYSHAEGEKTRTNGMSSHAEGKSTTTECNYSHAEGESTTTEGESSHAEGELTVSSGYCSHAEGSNTKSIGAHSHSEGRVTQAIGSHSHAEGASTSASGAGSHAEGLETEASGEYSHASGCRSKAIGNYSMAHGLECQAGDNSGDDHTIAEHSIALGNRAIAEEDFAFVFRGSNDKGVPNGSNGAGTFNLHLKNGINDIYVNDKRLSELVAQKKEDEPGQQNKPKFIELATVVTENYSVSCSTDTEVSNGDRLHTPETYSFQRETYGEWYDTSKVHIASFNRLTPSVYTLTGYTEQGLAIKPAGSKDGASEAGDAVKIWETVYELCVLTNETMGFLQVDVYQPTILSDDGNRVWADYIYCTCSINGSQLSYTEIPLSEFPDFENGGGSWGSKSVELDTGDPLVTFDETLIPGLRIPAVIDKGICVSFTTMYYNDAYILQVSYSGDVFYCDPWYEGCIYVDVEQVPAINGEDERYKVKQWRSSQYGDEVIDYGSTLIRKGDDWILTLTENDTNNPWRVVYDHDTFYGSIAAYSYNIFAECHLEGSFTTTRHIYREAGEENLRPLDEWKSVDGTEVSINVKYDVIVNGFNILDRENDEGQSSPVPMMTRPCTSIYAETVEVMLPSIKNGDLYDLHVTVEFPTEYRSDYLSVCLSPPSGYKILGLTDGSSYWLELYRWVSNNSPSFKIVEAMPKCLAVHVGNYKDY